MENNTVTTQEVITMASRLGFRYGTNDKGVPSLTYSTATGFVMEFPVPWMKDGGFYMLDQVSNQLNAMKNSAKLDEDVYEFLRNKANQEKINKACLDFGMIYDNTDRRFYYVVKGKAVFGVDHDYIASMVCTGKADIGHLDALLETFKETAEFESEQSAKASGKGLIKCKKGSKVDGRKKRG